jgi:hypothetical protein
MVLWDLKGLTSSHWIEALADPLRDAGGWYEKQLSFPETMSQRMLFHPRLLETSTQQLAAILTLLEFSEAEREFFWVAKF